MREFRRRGRERNRERKRSERRVVEEWRVEEGEVLTILRIFSPSSTVKQVKAL